MRIAQIAPLAESVPPKLYGGTERVVHGLTDELVANGHEVTLFASGDSKTSARLVPVIPQALRLGRPRMDPIAAQAQRHARGRAAVHGVEDVCGQAAHAGSVSAAVQNSPRRADLQPKRRLARLGTRKAC